MPIPVLQPPMPTFQSTHPGLMAAQATTQTLGDIMRNIGTAQTLPYAGPEAQAELQRQQLANQLAQATLPYAAPAVQAQLKATQLANLLAKAKLPYAGETAKGTAEIALLKSKYPLLFTPGAAGQVGAIQYLQAQQAQPPAQQIQQQAIQPTDTGTISIAPQVNLQQTLQQLQQPISKSETQPSISEGVPQVNEPTQQLNADKQVTGGVNDTLKLGMPNASSNQIDAISKSLYANLNKTLAQTKYYEQRGMTYPYNLMPNINRQSSLAQAAGMGYDNTIANKLFTQGKTLLDLARDAGFDPNKPLPTPIYPTTTASNNLIQSRRMAIAELDKIQSPVTAALAPYSRRFVGYSPKQIAEGLQGENPDAQARYLAARAILPEISAIRMRAMTGRQVGIEAIRELRKTMTGDIKVFQPLVSSDVFTASQAYLNQWINQGVKAANDQGLRATQIIARAEQQRKTGVPVTAGTTLAQVTSSMTIPTKKTTGFTDIRDPQGNVWEIPNQNVQKALKAGGVLVK